MLAETWCRLLLVSVLLGASARSRAQERTVDVEDMQLDELLERDLDDRLGTTDAVSRKSEDVITAPTTISTLSWEQIRHSGARTVPDLLRWVPGVQVYRNGPGNYIVALRGTGGLNGNNVVVNINGVPINSPLDASIDWDLIPLHVLDIERIEVVRGPVSTIYGQNAYTGVVNIVTRQAYGQSTAFAVRGEAGADLALGPLGALSGRYGRNSESSRVNMLAIAELDGIGAHNEHDGHADHAEEVPTMRRGGSMASFELLTAPKSRLRIDVGASTSERSSLDHLVQETHLQRRSLLLGSMRFGVQELTDVVESVELWSRSTLQLTAADASEFEGFSYAGTSSNRTAAGADVGLRFAPGFGLTLGGEADFDWIDAPYVNPSANDRFYPGYGGYSTVSYSPLEALHFTLGGRLDVPTATAELKPSYRGGVVYEATDWSVRLAAASAYRTPSYVELGGRFVDPQSGLILLEGDPDLRSPTNETLELGLIAAPLAALHIQPTVYVSRLRDVIIEDFERLVRRTFDNDPTDRYLLGTELEAEWNVRDDLGFALHFGTLHWLDVDESVTPTVGVPEQSSTLVAGARLYGSLLYERFGYGLGVNYASERVFAVRAGVPPSILDTTVPTQTHAFAMAEYFLGTSLPLWVSMRVFVATPDGAPESPLPIAAHNTSSAILGVAYREE